MRARVISYGAKVLQLVGSKVFSCNKQVAFCPDTFLPAFSQSQKVKETYVFAVSMDDKCALSVV